MTVVFGDKRIPRRFWRMVVRDGRIRDCWYWAAARDRGGYGEFGLRPGKMVKTHRYAYEMLIGPIPCGLFLDHLCRVRFCLNPTHLEPVTPRENVLRGEGVAARNAKVTRCPSGHPYTDDNLRVYGRARHCRACGNKAGKAYRDSNPVIVKAKARARYWLRRGGPVPKDVIKTLRGVLWVGDGKEIML